MNNKLLSVSCAITVVSLSPLLNAASGVDDHKSETIDCSYGESYAEGLPTHLVDLQQEAVKVGKAICLSSLQVLPNESIEVTKELAHFAKAAKQEFDELFPDTDMRFEGLSDLSESWYYQVTDIRNDYRNFALIEARNEQTDTVPPKTKGIEFKLYADPGSKKYYELTEVQKDHCREVINHSSIDWSGNKDCKSAWNLWSNAVSPFQSLYTNRVLEDNGQKIIRLQNQWSTFIDKSRYQTPLDVWATTAYFSDQFKRLQLSGPPPVQLFLFHPAIVYEHLPEADKGSKEDVSIALEWIGVNWWRKGFGLSLTSVYNDRKDQPSVGTGATFHIGNHYSVGYIYRDDGDDSVFFNIELLEWFGDKRDKYRKYKAYFE
ncbi:hypothetical protein [Marinobacter alexandrii]|uniref:hypothetical protein n=4 Tax=Pseudomonadota TaxID=1224 RepID=UPI003266FE21